MEHFADAAVEALDHTVGLRVPGFDEAMFDGMLDTDLVEGIVAGGLALAGGAEAVGELLTVIGEHLGELERRSLDEAFEEGAGVVGTFRGQDLHVDPARGAVDGGEQILACVLIGHLRQVLHVHVHEAWLIVLERLGGPRLRRITGHQVREPGDPVAAQAAVQARA